MVYSGKSDSMCHSLRGLCGLKYHNLPFFPFCFLSQPARAVWIEIGVFNGKTLTIASQPARAVWIEILRLLLRTSVGDTSQPARAVWIEIENTSSGERHTVSQPARAVWIEILFILHQYPNHEVTACEGCVD